MNCPHDEAALRTQADGSLLCSGCEQPRTTTPTYFRLRDSLLRRRFDLCVTRWETIEELRIDAYREGLRRGSESSANPGYVRDRSDGNAPSVPS